jgi:hypothetical protein
MIHILALSNAEAVGWICFFIGAAGVLAGGILGGLWAFGEAHTAVAAGEDTPKKKEEVGKAARETVEKVSSTAELAAKSQPSKALEEKAKEDAKAAQSTVADLAAIIKALPERLRFWGFLILIGGLLMSVATIEFNGHSIF